MHLLLLSCLSDLSIFFFSLSGRLISNRGSDRHLKGRQILFLVLCFRSVLSLGNLSSNLLGFIGLSMLRSFGRRSV